MRTLAWLGVLFFFMAMPAGMAQDDGDKPKGGLVTIAVDAELPVKDTGPRKQFQKEVGIVSIKGPQSLRHDLDGLAIGRTQVHRAA